MRIYTAVLLACCALLHTAPPTGAASLQQELQALQQLLQQRSTAMETDPETRSVDVTTAISARDLEDLLHEDVTQAELAAMMDAHHDLMDLILSRKKRDASPTELEQEIQIELAPEQTPHSRPKRQLASIARGIIASGRGWRLSQQLTDGCGSYPTICVEQERIDELVILIDASAVELNGLYLGGLDDYNDLSDSVYNQDYMMRAVDEGLHSLADIHVLVTELVGVLLTDLSALITQADTGVITNDQFAHLVLSPLETLLMSMRSLLQRPDVTHDIGQALAVKEMLADVVGEYFLLLTTALDDQGFQLNDGRLGNIVNAEKKLSTQQMQTLLGAIFGGDLDSVLEYVGGYIKGAFSSVGDDVVAELPLVSSVFEDIFGRPFLYIGGIYGELTSRVFSGRRVLDNYRAGILDDMVTVLEGLHSIQGEMQSTQWNQFSSANYKLSWDLDLNVAADAQYDTLSSLMVTWDWARIAEEMTLIRLTHEYYYGNLTAAIDTIHDDLVSLESVWGVVIENFRNTSEVMQGVIDRGTTGEDLQVVNALEPAFTIVPSTYFGDLVAMAMGTGDLLREQSDMLPVLQSVVEGYRIIGAHVSSRTDFYSSILEQVNAGTTVLYMAEFITEILSYSLAVETRDFAANLAEEHFLCVVANVFVTRDSYDFFALDEARALCNEGVGTYEALRDAARGRRYEHMMQDWIGVDVQASPAVAVVTTLDAVQREFNRIDLPGMAGFAAALTEKDILCAVPQYTEADFYDSYELTLFRDATSCDDVTDNEWAAVRQAKVRLDYTITNVAVELDFCARWAFCMCWNFLRVRYILTDAELEHAMKTVEPGRTQYCGGSPWSTCPDPVCRPFS